MPNSVGPDQAAHLGAVCSGSLSFVCLKTKNFRGRVTYKYKYVHSMHNLKPSQKWQKNPEDQGHEGGASP